MAHHYTPNKPCFRCLSSERSESSNGPEETRYWERGSFGVETSQIMALVNRGYFWETSAEMTRRYLDLGSASDWLKQISYAARPIRSTTQIWVVTRNQYGISAFVSQTSFGRETSGSVTKCRLFSQASLAPTIWWTLILSFQHDLPSNLLPLIVFFGYTLQGTFDTSTNI